MTEWRPVVGMESDYRVSIDGQVISLISGSPRLMRPAVDLRGYAYLNLRRKPHRVHRLVAAAFIGPDLRLIRHLDGNALNNHVSNLAYGTASENGLDTVAHGRHHNAVKTHCIRGHEYSEENTYNHGRNRYCRKCSVINQRNSKARKKGITT